MQVVGSRERDGRQPAGIFLPPAAVRMPLPTAPSNWCSMLYRVRSPAPCTRGRSPGGKHSTGRGSPERRSRPGAGPLRRKDWRPRASTRSFRPAANSLLKRALD
jgi:hypothetical protein